MQQHAYVIEGSVEEGIKRAEDFIQEELGMTLKANPDVLILRYGLLSVEEARGIADIAASASLAGSSKAIVIAAGRVYGDAQNALLKIFEEPPKGAYLFLVMPNLGGLLPTLKSRVQILSLASGPMHPGISEGAQEFIKMNKEKRSVLIKKLATGRDEEERREHRDEVLALLTGLERAAYKEGISEHAGFLADIAQLRAYLHAPSAPVRMILEHISLTLPGDLV